MDLTLYFSDVDSNKITDSLTVSIVSINGMDAETAGARGYMSISTEDFSALEAPFKTDWQRFGGIEITGYTGPGGNLVIPSNISRWPVTSIGEEAFKNKQLANVTLPAGLISIGEEAFRDNRLTGIILPDSVTSIGYMAFFENQLTSVTIPDSVTSIGRSAFGHNRLTSVTIPDSVTSIREGAFSENQLTKVTIGNSVTSIDGNAFSSNRLTSITIPDSVTSIGESAFAYNQLTSVTIPANVGLSAYAIDDRIFSFAYGANDSKAGTYVYSRNGWRMR
jgi:hypothetical protein